MPRGMTGSPAEYSFSTERLAMRPWKLSDEASYHEIFGDLRVVWWQSREPTFEDSRAALTRAIERQDSPQPGFGRFAMISNQTGGVVGNLMLCPAGFAEGIEVGYHIAHRHWGQGYATEAARAALKYGFGAMALHEIIGAVALTNGASLRIMEKLGMLPTYRAQHADLAHQMFRCRPTGTAPGDCANFD